MHCWFKLKKSDIFSSEQPITKPDRVTWRRHKRRTPSFVRSVRRSVGVDRLAVESAYVTLPLCGALGCVQLAPTLFIFRWVLECASKSHKERQAERETLRYALRSGLHLALRKSETNMRHHHLSRDGFQPWIVLERLVEAAELEKPKVLG